MKQKNNKSVADNEMPDAANPPDEISEPASAELTPNALLALRWFYDRLTLNDADRKLLFVKRGLTDATVEALGFRSNPDSNKLLLLEMPNHFPLEVLLESGLWKTDPDKAGEAAKPNPQFYGMSIVEKRDEKGRKVRDANGEAVRECVWNNPILIPYFNEARQLVHLRPHKGMMAGKSPCLYVLRPQNRMRNPHANGQTKFAIITEGEFKAAALWQVLGEFAEIAALPGITMAKQLFGDVLEWLEDIGVRHVIVAYDNEDKSDPNLLSYQREKHRRFDTHVWARYLARQLSKEGFDAKVCVLPDAWRDEKGKADWDGELAAQVKQHGMTDGSATEWQKIHKLVANEFLAVLDKSIVVGQSKYIKFFDDETEVIIRRALDKISYEPCLPHGAQEEQTLSRRLHRLANPLKQSAWFPIQQANFLTMLAKRYEATAGRYYKMKPLDENNLKQWKNLREEAGRRGDEDAKRACDIVLRGRKNLRDPERGHIPVTISDFYFVSHYILKRADGSRTRVVTIYNVNGVKTEFVEIPAENLGSPVKFRELLLNKSSGATWDGGQSELTALHEDLAHALAFKDVTEVPVRGYHKRSKIWFFEDIAFSDDDEYTPDKFGIFWIKDATGVHGYTFSRDTEGRPRDRENEVFRQGVPFMYPNKKDTVQDVQELFKEVFQKLNEALGGMQAYIALGIIFAAAAGPEIYGKWSCFPGLWIHGEQGEGKSALGRWLIRIWGYHRENGLPLPADDQRTTVTLAALSGALGQYGELPLWLDEYQSCTASWVQAILKNSYDRAEGAKKDFGNCPREFLASVIVSGVATSPESQTKSRFAHIQVSSKNRKGNHFEWFQENSHEFYRLGRFVLRHRKAFVESVISTMEAWIKSKAMERVNDRARMVHAVAYAGFYAACEILKVSANVLKPYWDWLVEHCKQSAAEVQESVTVDLFWNRLLNGVVSGAFNHSISELRKCIKIVEDVAAESPVSEHQIKAGAEHPYKAWKSYLIYLRPGPILESLRMHLRRSGETLAISQRDLHSQMKMRSYWHPSDDPSGHRQKFNGNTPSYCWCIKVDLHPQGIIRVGDPDFDASFKPTQVSTDWMDPRKGALFEIIDAILAKNNEEKD